MKDKPKDTEPTDEQLAEPEEKPFELMTLDELTTHIFSLEEAIKANMYDEYHSVEINDPDALVEDIEEVFDVVLEISMREIYSREIYPDFDRDSIKSIIDFRRKELREFEEGKRDWGEVGNNIIKRELRREIGLRNKFFE